VERVADMVAKPEKAVAAAVDAAANKAIDTLPRGVREAAKVVKRVVETLVRVSQEPER
jgi:hypothetical protein